MINRDMMYGGYYQNIPGSMIESNYNMQLPPGALMPNNMMTPFNMNNGMNNNNFVDSLCHPEFISGSQEPQIKYLIFCHTTQTKCVEVIDFNNSIQQDNEIFLDQSNSTCQDI